MILKIDKRDVVGSNLERRELEGADTTTWNCRQHADVKMVKSFRVQLYREWEVEVSGWAAPSRRVPKMQWPCTGLGHWIPVATGFLLSGAWPRWGRTALSSPSGHWHDHNVLSVLSYVRHNIVANGVPRPPRSRLNSALPSNIESNGMAPLVAARRAQLCTMYTAA